MKTFNQFQEDMSKLPGLGGGGGGTNAITSKSKGKTLKNRFKDVGKVLTRPLHKKRVDPNEKFATEGVAAMAIKGGSKLVPALMTGIGAAGMIMQSKKRKLPKDSEGMPDELAKLGRKAKVTLKRGMRDFKKGLAAGQEVPKQGAKGRFSNPNAKLVRDMMKEKARKGDSYAKRFLQQIKDKRTKNKDIDKKLEK